MKLIKIIIAIICLMLGVLYQLYFEGVIVIVDQEFTDFLSGVLVGVGISLLVYGLFNPKKYRLQEGK